MFLYQPFLFKLFKQCLAALDHIPVGLIKTSRIPGIGDAPSRSVRVIQQQLNLAFDIRPGDTRCISYVRSIRTQQQVIMRIVRACDLSGTLITEIRICCFSYPVLS